MNIDYSEIERYLGYRGKKPDSRTKSLINECLIELKSAVPRSVTREFKLTIKPDSVLLGTLEIKSQKLRNHINDCDRAVLICATLGSGVDALIAKHSHIDLARCAVLQACAAAMIESYCNEIEQYLCEKGLTIRPRFSPGYGDFSLEYQPELLNLLGAQSKIGLCSTDSHMLTPTKSVTAIIGILGKTNRQ